MSQTSEKLSLAEALSAARETRCLELGHGVLGRTPELFRQQFGGKPALLVADTNTFAAAGLVVREAFRRAGQACREPFVFTDPKLYAEHQHVVALEEALKERMPERTLLESLARTAYWGSDHKSAKSNS